jgi:hypothetical protein
VQSLVTATRQKFRSILELDPGESTSLHRWTGLGSGARLG